MSRFSMIKRNLLFLSKRTYASTASDGIRIQTTTISALKKEASESREKIAENITPERQEKEVSWMRDPTSGDWIPETHFDEVDVVELRQKLLFKKLG